MPHPDHRARRVDMQVRRHGGVAVERQGDQLVMPGGAVVQPQQAVSMAARIRSRLTQIDEQVADLAAERTALQARIDVLVPAAAPGSPAAPVQPGAPEPEAPGGHGRGRGPR